MSARPAPRVPLPAAMIAAALAMSAVSAAAGGGPGFSALPGTPADPSPGEAPPAAPAPRALVEVRTLVMDALGTRTVDTSRARVPFGSRGLLIRRVPYAGPPLSFRLEVLAGPPQESGIPLTLRSEVWTGDVDAPPPAAQVSHREEATILPAEGSYLLEIDFDPQTGRRIVLSLAARVARPEDEEIPFPVAPAGPSVRFVLEVMREAAGVADPPDQRVMSSLVGEPITYSSGTRLPAPAGDPGNARERLVGLTVTLEAEQVQGNLVSVRLELQGAEFTDAQRTRLEPFTHRAIHTVASGTAFEASLSVPQEAPGPPTPGTPAPVRYIVRVTPFIAR